MFKADNSNITLREHADTLVDYQCMLVSNSKE